MFLPHPVTATVDIQPCAVHNQRDRAGQVPLKHLGASEDVANAAAFLASDLVRYITATELVVDGGLSSAPIAG